MPQRFGPGQRQAAASLAAAAVNINGLWNRRSAALQSSRMRYPRVGRMSPATPPKGPSPSHEGEHGDTWPHILVYRSSLTPSPGREFAATACAGWGHRTA